MPNSAQAMAQARVEEACVEIQAIGHYAEPHDRLEAHHLERLRVRVASVGDDVAVEIVDTLIEMDGRENTRYHERLRPLGQIFAVAFTDRRPKGMDRHSAERAAQRKTARTVGAARAAMVNELDLSILPEPSVA